MAGRRGQAIKARQAVEVTGIASDPEAARAARTCLDHGLTSIVIVAHNQLPFTRQCIDSIRQYSDELYELIIVDNASNDGTAEYLESLGEAKIIRNDKNLGFPAAANQGIRAATGKQILLLNNDTLVTTGWLHRLLRALHSDPKMGLVGPCSNCAGDDQQVDITYDDLTGLDGFAWNFGKANDAQLQPTDRLVGFCLLIRRELIDAIGFLDEQFGVGCFEDDDYCCRALVAGYGVAIARDAFVHHFGSQTFMAAGIDFPRLMSENHRLFQAKWKPLADWLSRSVPSSAALAASSTGLCRPGGKPARTRKTRRSQTHGRPAPRKQMPGA